MVIFFFFFFLSCLVSNVTSIFSMSNQCGTIRKEPNQGDGGIAYTRITDLGKRTTVRRQEQGGSIYFIGSRDDIFGYGSIKQLSSKKSARKWHKMQRSCEELIKMQKEVKNRLKNREQQS